MVGFELTVCETQFAIHFDNFAEHFFRIFVKFVNRSLIVKPSFIFKDKFGEVRNEITLVLVKKQISCIYYITVTLARGLIRVIAVLVLVL